MWSRAQIAFAFFTLGLLGCRPKRTPTPLAAESPSASASTASRCSAPTEGTTLGKPAPRDTEDDDPFPSSVQVGSAVAHAGGFSVGVVMPIDGHPKAAVVELGPRANLVRTIPLLRAHGDTQPPRVAVGPAGVVGAVLEASGSLRSLRTFRLNDGQVSWGPAVDEKRDESLAHDIAVGRTHTVLVWDEDDLHPPRGVVRLLSIPNDGTKPSLPRSMTPKSTNAESPRLVVRPGGFWLTYVVARPETTPVADDARYRAEAREHRFLEVLQLDDEGTAVAPAKRVTPDNGHVLSYDAATSGDGGLSIVWRDDDTPLGSSGGSVHLLRMRPDGSVEAQPLSDRDVGVGSPVRLPGFVVVPDAKSLTRLVAVDATGKPLGSLEPEPALAVGEALAQRADQLLIAQFRGPSVTLFTVECSARP